ncbi:MAG: hypothetical protein ACLP6G_13425 [Terriglobales bacterium]
MSNSSPSIPFLRLGAGSLQRLAEAISGGFVVTEIEQETPLHPGQPYGGS